MKLRITINDKTFDVDVEVAEADHSALPPAYPIGSAVLSGQVNPGVATPGAGSAPGSDAPEDKVCRSPVSGIVVRVIAQEGQSLQAGDALMVLEAMKMETNIAAPIAGRIVSIKAKQGDNVQAGQVVVEFE